MPATTSWLAWGIWAVTLALSAIGGALVLLTIDAQVPDNWGFRGYWDLLGPLFASAGLLIALRQPRNPIGWLLLVAGASTGFSGLVQEYVTYGVTIHPGSLPAVAALAWIASWSWFLFAGPMLTIVPQLFPNGRPLSPRWRPLIWVGVALIPLNIFFFGLRPGPLENAVAVDNPFILAGVVEDVRAILYYPTAVALVAATMASGASLVVRYRRARGRERQQVKWMALSAALLATAFAVLIATNESKPAQIVTIAAFATMPVAIGIAILKHRLYDIDLLINRAIVYGALSAILGATYVAFVILFQAALRPMTAGSELAVAASTLAVVALVQPLRRRIQDQVDRRFYRSRYDAARTLDAFATRLRDEVDLDSVRAEVVGVMAETVRPSHASVWLRSRA